MTPPDLPILYTFRRCPYAMRARLALSAAGITVQPREVDLNHKPAALLTLSAKATVPVLQLADGTVLAESLDIMYWALDRHDPENWLEASCLEQAAHLIQENDTSFKSHLDRYKYPERFWGAPDTGADLSSVAAFSLAHRQLAELFLHRLEQQLWRHGYLCAAHFCLADAAIAPFIRQFAAVDADWFAQAPYPLLQSWLAEFCDSPRFAAVMRKLAVWQEPA